MLRNNHRITQSGRWKFAFALVPFFAFYIYCFRQAINYRHKIIENYASARGSNLAMQTFRYQELKDKEFSSDLVNELKFIIPIKESEKIQAIKNAIILFTNAFSHGDFETYWKFRNPQGTTVVPDTRKLDMIRATLKKYNAYTSGDQMDDPKMVLQAQWSLQRKGQNQSHAPCVDCFHGIALRQMKVRSFMLKKSEVYSITHVLGKREWSGYAIAEGVLNLKPSLYDLQHSQAGVEMFVIDLAVKAKDETVVPIVYVGYWWSEGNMLLPCAIAVGDTESIASRLMF